MTTVNEKGMDQKTFENTLKAFKNATLTGKRLARKLAEASYIHFMNHGDLRYAQGFVDAMEKHGRNYVRKAAFLAWLAAYSPLAMQGSKLVKDKDDNAKPFNVDKAMEKPFWDFAPETPFVMITESDVVVSFERAIARFIKARDNLDKDGNPAPKIEPEAAKLIPEMQAFVEKLKEDAGIVTETAPADTEETEAAIDTSDPTEAELEAAEEALIPTAKVA